MINWLLFYHVYIAGSVVLIVLHKLFRVLPPRDSRGWIVLSLALVSILIGAWFYLEPYLYFELDSVKQWTELAIAALLHHMAAYVIYDRLLKE